MSEFCERERWVWRGVSLTQKGQQHTVVSLRPLFCSEALTTEKEKGACLYACEEARTRRTTTAEAAVLYEGKKREKGGGDQAMIRA